MSRRQGGHGGGGGAHDAAGMGRWLLTYADMITLLLVFFIVLYAMSQVNKYKYETLIRALHSVLTGSRPLPAVGGSPQSVTAAQVKQLAQLAQQIQQAVDDSHNKTDVNVSSTDQEVRVTLYNGVLFREGQASIEPSGIPLLMRIAAILAATQNRIIVQGYTDSLPIHTARFHSNWDLAAIRATTVLSFLISQGVAPNRFEAEAFGRYAPIASNATTQGRQMNRRVDIVVLREIGPFTAPAPSTGSAATAPAQGTLPHIPPEVHPYPMGVTY